MPSKLKKKLTQQEFYCVSCRKRVKSAADDMCVQVFKNSRRKGGAPALRSECACGCALTKFIKDDDKSKLTAKYGKC